METGFLVCTVTCLDRPQEQLRPRILPPDPVPVFNPRPELFAVENGLQGFTLYTLDPPPYPAGTGGPFWTKAYVLGQLASVSGVPVALVDDFSGTITRSQVAQALVPSVGSLRSYLAIFNPTSAPMAVSFSTAVLGAVTSIMVYEGQTLFYSTGTLISLNAMTVVGFRPGAAYYAWQNTVDTELLNDGGVLVLESLNGVDPIAPYPESPSGLPAGAVWSNGLAVAVVPGIAPDPSAPPVIFGQITADQLLALGGGNLPTDPPTIGSLQLWNNSGEIAIA